MYNKDKSRNKWNWNQKNNREYKVLSGGSSKRLIKLIVMTRNTWWKERQTTNIRNDTGVITADTTDIKNIIRTYYDQHFPYKFQNLEKNVAISQTQKLTSLTK